MMPENYAETLRQKARKAYAEVEKIISLAKAEKRDLTNDELQKTDAYQMECDSYLRQAEVHAKQSQINSGLELLESVKSISLFGDPGGGAPPVKADEPQVDKWGNRIFSEAKALNTYLCKTLNGMTPEERKYLSSTSDADGGVMVTQEMSRQIITKLQEESYIRRYATVFPTSMASFATPAFNCEDDPAIYGEGKTITETNVANDFGKVILTPSKMAILFKIPQELLEDSWANIEQLLIENFALRFALKEEYYFLNGTGVNQPKGLLQTTGFTSHPVESATSDTIIADDLADIDLYLSPAYRRNAVFIAPTVTMRQIVKLRTREAGDSTGQYLWRPSFSAGTPATLLGYPLIESTLFTAPTALGDPLLLFGNLKTYFIADRIQTEIKRLEELYSADDKIGIRMRKRVDGTPTDANAFVRLNRT